MGPFYGYSNSCMMNKTFLVGVVALLVGIVAGAGGMLLAFPFLFPPVEVNEQLRNVDSKSTIASGTFIHPDPDDRAHWGKGNVRVVQGGDGLEVFLEPDFEVGPGPDYYAYFVAASDIVTNDQFEQAEKTMISRLKSFRGSQVYAVMSDVPEPQRQSVVVWCRTFGMLITSATLTPATDSAP